jgi:hypothetical protein
MSYARSPMAQAETQKNGKKGLEKQCRPPPPPPSPPRTDPRRVAARADSFLPDARAGCGRRSRCTRSTRLLSRARYRAHPEALTAACSCKYVDKSLARRRRRAARAGQRVCCNPQAAAKVMQQMECWSGQPMPGPRTVYFIETSAFICPWW